jgi:exosortase/archaeosortase family protein
MQVANLLMVDLTAAFGAGNEPTQMDRPLPWRRAVPVFLFGVAGTWLQNVIRLVLILCSGYFFGENTLLAVHFWIAYILFPLWYLLFALVYSRLVQKPPVPRQA